MKLITKAIEKSLPPIYHTKDMTEGEKKVVVKFFTPDAQVTWYVIEGEKREDGEWDFFGFIDAGDPAYAEYGYFTLSQLLNVRGQFGLPVERDIHFTGTMADVKNLK